MKKNVRLLNKQNKHWYSHEKNTKWAIQDKEGNWWLVNGSEFPEKKIEEDEEVKCGLPPSFDFKVNDCTTDSEVKTIYITVHK